MARVTASDCRPLNQSRIPDPNPVPQPNPMPHPNPIPHPKPTPHPNRMPNPYLRAATLGPWTRAVLIVMPGEG